MRPILIGLTVADVLVLAAAALVGWLAQGERLFAYHFALGLFGSVYTVLVHVVVYIYFIVAGKVVAQAAQRAAAPDDLELRARTLKTRAFRCAMLGVIPIIAAAILGARVASVGLGPDGAIDEARRSAAVTLHMLVALAALALQPFVAMLHYDLIGRQSALHDQALAELEAVRRARAAGQPS